MNKKLIPLIVTLFILTGVRAQHIPDANFAKALHEKYPDCIDEKDNLLPAAGNQDILKLENFGIRDISGIEGFKKLEFLYVSRNSLTELPTLPEKILILECDENQLSGLVNLPDDLERFLCQKNRLVKLPDLPKKLRLIRCDDNKLKLLPGLPESLKTLYCQHNKISICPEFSSNLTEIDISDNEIKHLSNIPSEVQSLVCDVDIIDNVPYGAGFEIVDASGKRRYKGVQTETVKEKTVTTTTSSTMKNYLIMDMSTYSVYEFGAYHVEHTMHGLIISADSKISAGDVKSNADFYAKASNKFFDIDGYKDKVMFDDCTDENGDCEQTYKKYFNLAKKEEPDAVMDPLEYIYYGSRH